MISINLHEILDKSVSHSRGSGQVYVFTEKKPRKRKKNKMVGFRSSLSSIALGCEVSKLEADFSKINIIILHFALIMMG